jgi:hypothetical protein
MSGGTDESQAKPTVRTANLRAEIWTRDLLNTKQECQPPDPNICAVFWTHTSRFQLALRLVTMETRPGVKCYGSQAEAGSIVCVAMETSSCVEQILPSPFMLQVIISHSKMQSCWPASGVKLTMKLKYNRCRHKHENSLNNSPRCLAAEHASRALTAQEAFGHNSEPAQSNYNSHNRFSYEAY